MTRNKTSNNEWLSAVRDKSSKSTRKKAKKISGENCNRAPLRTVQFKDLSNKNTILHQTRVSSYFKKTGNYSKPSASNFETLINCEKHKESILNDNTKININELSPCMVSNGVHRRYSSWVPGNSNEQALTATKRLRSPLNCSEGRYRGRINNDSLNKSQVNKRLSFSNTGESYLASPNYHYAEQSLSGKTNGLGKVGNHDEAIFGDTNHSISNSSSRMEPPSPLILSQDIQFNICEQGDAYQNKEVENLFSDSPLDTEKLSDIFVNATNNKENTNVCLFVPSALYFTEEDCIDTHIKNGCMIAGINDDDKLSHSWSDDGGQVGDSYTCCVVPSPINFTEI